jgi:cytoskeleton protein RodZ
MSDSPLSEPPQAAATAGALLRQARLAKGLHIAALATSIKVAPRKLELLESDRFDELPGATFTRALAQTVCRSLKIDSAPVLALLPQPVDHGLAQMSLGLNAPFRDRPGRRVPSDLQFLRSPIVLGALALFLAAVLLYILLPAGSLSDIKQRTSSITEPTVSPAPPPVIAAPASFPQAAPVVEVIPAASAPDLVATQPAASQAAPPVLAATSGALLLRTSAESWVEVIDARGMTLLSRMLQAGETVGLDGASPLRLRIGNAAATQVTYKGKAIELVPTRDNVAKLELR